MFIQSFGRRYKGIIMGIIIAGILTFSFPVFSQEKVEIAFLSQEEDPATVKVYKKLIEKFESENPNIKIRYLIAGVTEVIGKVATAVPAGKIDVFQPSPEMAFKLAQEGFLLPLNDVVEKLGGKQSFPQFSIMEMEGKFYGVPFAGGARTLWYRRDLFKKYGIVPPMTWDEMATVVEKLCLDTDGDGKKDLYGIGIPAGRNVATDFWFRHFLYQGGSQVFDRDLQIVFDNPYTVETMKFYVQLCKNAPPGVLNYSWFEPLQVFLAGKAAITCRGGRIFGKVYRDVPDLIGKVDTLQFLKGRMRCVMVDYSMYSAAGNTKHPEAAKKWIEFLLEGRNNVRILLTVPGHLYPTTPEQEKAFFESGNEIIEADDFAYIMWKNFIAVKKYGYYPILNAGGIDMEDCKLVATGVPNPYLSVIVAKNIIPEAVQEVLLGESTPEEAVEKAAEKMKKALMEAKG